MVLRRIKIIKTGYIGFLLFRYSYWDQWLGETKIHNIYFSANFNQFLLGDFLHFHLTTTELLIIHKSSRLRTI